MIPIVFSVSNFFVPYFSVCLHSLLQHINSSQDYIIYILEQNISDANKTKLKKAIKTPNVKLEFVDFSSKIKDHKFILHSHVTVETFFKLYIPLIFSSYPKILFCDADIIFNADPAQLFQINIGNHKLAATPCNLWNGIINHNPQAYKYTIDTLGIKNINTYFQGGVIIFNNKQINKTNIQELLSLAEAESYICLDQDVLNKYFQNDIFLLDSKWNYETSQKTFREESIPFMDKEHKQQWTTAAQSPFIIHYSGKEKPWFFPEEEFANKWWELACQTDFYQEIFSRLHAFQILNPEIQQLRKEFAQVHFPNINNRFAANEYNTKLLFVIEHPMRFKLKKSWYAIKKAFAFGKRYQKYKQKYQKLKTLLKDAKKLKKSFFKI